MNDFTKEELESIIQSFEHIEYRETFGWDDHLKIKLQSLIDNYCEHESSGIRYAVMKLRSTDTRDFEYRCVKCNKVMFQY